MTGITHSAVFVLYVYEDPHSLLMYEAATRDLRKNERFLIDPPLSGHFGAAVISVSDISIKGARFRHGRPLETGNKTALRLAIEGRPSPVLLEAAVVWTQADSGMTGQFVSGVRLYGSIDVISGMLRHLQKARRTTRIEELRAADRFFVNPSLEAQWNGEGVHIADLSARGARLETTRKLETGASGELRFAAAAGSVAVDVPTKVVWSTLRSVDPSTYRGGLLIPDRSEGVRLAIGQLCESGRATIDTHSLGLKLKVIRARARQLAPSFRDIEASGVPAEQYILIQSVREELRLNPEEAMHWYQRARLLIRDPSIRTLAPSIADHPDALAVWEYLERTIDPSIIGRTFALPSR